jgi:transposase
MFGVPGIRVLDARDDGRVLRLTVETAGALTACRCCGGVARAHGRREHRLRDAPFGHRQVVVAWRKRVWRFDEPACPESSRTEVHALAEPRAVLTNRAIGWATDALAADDTTVSALARRAGVGWHTLWRPVAREAARRAADPARLSGVTVLGVDEHVWRPGRWGGWDATCMVDLTRAEDGLLRARLLDLVPGRSGTVYRAWLEDQTEAFRAGVTRAALDPFRGYANALRDALPDAPPVLDPSHVVKLGSQMLDEVRRRVQQDTLGHRGHKSDPLYRIGQPAPPWRRAPDRPAGGPPRRRPGRRRPGLAGQHRLAVLPATPRSIYHASTPAAGADIATRVIASFPSCPIPEVARLGRTLRAWRSQPMAYFVTEQISTGGTEAISLIIEKTRRLAHGFRNFNNYRLRLLLVADGRRPYPRRRPRHA